MHFVKPRCGNAESGEGDADVANKPCLQSDLDKEGFDVSLGRRRPGGAEYLRESEAIIGIE